MVRVGRALRGGAARLAGRPGRARCRRRRSARPGWTRPRPTRTAVVPGAGPGERPTTPRRRAGLRRGQKRGERSSLRASFAAAAPGSYPCTGLCCAALCVALAPSARSRGARWRSASPLRWCGTACGCARRWCRRSRGRRPPRSRSPPRARRCATRASTRSRCGPTSPTTTCPTTIRRRSCARVRVDYPIARRPRCSGSGSRPPIRLQRALGREGEVRPHDFALSVVHWSWFLVPHGTCAYILLRHRERTSSAPRCSMAACFDLGCVVYWVLPTAPPWWAGQSRASCRRCAGSWPRPASASGDASGSRSTIRLKAIRSPRCPHSTSAHP